VCYFCCRDHFRLILQLRFVWYSCNYKRWSLHRTSPSLKIRRCSNNEKSVDLSDIFIPFFCGISPFIWVLFAPKYRSYFFTVGIVLCLLISSVVYTRMYQIIRYHRRQIYSYEMNGRNNKKMAQRRRNASNMFVVYCVLLSCYLPYSISLAFAKVYGYTQLRWIAVNFALTIININSSLNPFIYCYRMREIRRAMLVTLCTALQRVRSVLPI